MHFPMQEFAVFLLDRAGKAPTWIYCTTARTFQTTHSGVVVVLGIHAASLLVAMSGVDASSTPPIYWETNDVHSIDVYLLTIQRIQDEFMVHPTLREGVGAV